MNELPLEFRGADGLVRRGIASVPAGRAGTGVVLLPAGLKYRIGPSRLNLLFARSLANAGYPVLRFDPLGVGESDGTIEAAPMHSVLDSIGRGRFVADTVLACHAMRERFGVDKVIVGGLCGGAMTAMLAASERPDAVQGLLLLSAPLTLSGATETASAPELSSALARHYSRAYVRKLLSVEAWRRVLRGESDFARIYAALKSAAKDRFWPSAGVHSERFPNENPFFMESFRRINKGQIPQLFLFGGSDNRWVEFDNGVVVPHLAGQRSGPFFDIKVVHGANHEFQSGQARQQLLADAHVWLAKRFPLAPAREFASAGGHPCGKQMNGGEHGVA